ncbi:8486_t:CDS:2 [Funneliformis geosporum]|uniref:13204_t:CDS:1 n=1 Tax=Funneliformis geosporum TaxID=1117311 RepID=A0A9W4SQ67_9GLOM|nr:8486_t:CDS:2 [Funneliformis geosporum]CAI2177602.1 13204_t:CDS:2 [Funneliformis geosporum]
MAELTFYLIFVSFAVVLGSFQFGYHIGELNTPKSVISCETLPPDGSYDGFLSPCIPMNEGEFSLVTSIFNLGGLVGSLISPRVADNKGRRWTLMFNIIFLLLGPTTMGFSSSFATLVIGRVIAGIGCGVVSVVVPMYLAEISPAEYRGTFGVMNQLGIVTGILFSQVQGLYLSYIPGWRIIILFASALSIIQMVFLGFAVESPKYLVTTPGGYQSAKRALQRLRGKIDVEEELGGWRQVASEEGLEGLIGQQQQEVTSNSQQHSELLSQNVPETDIVESPSVVFHARNIGVDDFSIWKFITSLHYRPALMVLLFIQFTQQFSGINAVIFYSTTILSTILPTSSDLITVYISIVNTIMTIISAYLMDKAGRRTLLLYSISLMSLCSILLALGITHEISLLSSISIIGFVATYAIGLGPIPFLIIPEIVDTRAVATASSLGLSVNWTSNFLVASLFLEGRVILGGNVFYIFAIYLIIAYIVAIRILPETKAKTVEEVWHDWNVKYVK